MKALKLISLGLLGMGLTVGNNSWGMDNKEIVEPVNQIINEADSVKNFLQLNSNAHEVMSPLVNIAESMKNMSVGEMYKKIVDAKDQNGRPYKELFPVNDLKEIDLSSVGGVGAVFCDKIAKAEETKNIEEKSKWTRRLIMITYMSLQYLDLLCQKEQPKPQTNNNQPK